MVGMHEKQKHEFRKGVSFLAAVTMIDSVILALSDKEIFLAHVNWHSKFYISVYSVLTGLHRLQCH